MKLTNEQTKQFMCELLDELNKQYWGDIDPEWLVMKDSEEYDEDHKINHNSLVKIFKTTLNNFKPKDNAIS